MAPMPELKNARDHSESQSLEISSQLTGKQLATLKGDEAQIKVEFPKKQELKNQIRAGQALFKRLETKNSELQNV